MSSRTLATTVDQIIADHAEQLRALRALAAGDVVILGAGGAGSLSGGGSSTSFPHAHAEFIPKALLDVRGQIIVAIGDADPQVLDPPMAGTVLAADMTEPLRMAWTDPSAIANSRRLAYFFGVG